MVPSDLEFFKDFGNLVILELGLWILGALIRRTFDSEHFKTGLLKLDCSSSIGWTRLSV